MRLASYDSCFPTCVSSYSLWAFGKRKEKKGNTQHLWLWLLALFRYMFQSYFWKLTRWSPNCTVVHWHAYDIFLFFFCQQKVKKFLLSDQERKDAKPVDKKAWLNFLLIGFFSWSHFSDEWLCFLCFSTPIYMVNNWWGHITTEVLILYLILGNPGNINFVRRVRGLARLDGLHFL